MLLSTPTFQREVLPPAETFTPAAFFDFWFKERGTSYYFLFKKNLRVTNIQLAELVALLRSSVKDRRSGSRPNDLLFISSNDFKGAVSAVVDQMTSGEDSIDSAMDTFNKLYGDVYSNMVVLDAFYGSAVVFLPEFLEIDERWISAQSGYIHSSGHNVYIRATGKLDKVGLIASLERHLARYPSDKQVFMAAYAHEDFTRYDRKREAHLRDGLDDVKIHLEKFYLGSERLPTIIDELRDHFRGRLFVPPPGDYHQMHLEARQKHTIDATRTIWIMVERAVGPDFQRGDETYLICYDQHYINENPFHLFDENKPAWVSHTTIPHTLMGAMINITRPWHEDSTTIVSDPFVGTGTTWLEGLKTQGTRFLCSDLNPMAPLLVEDNLSIFQMHSKALQSITTELRTAISIAQSRSHQEELFPLSQLAVKPEMYDRAVELVQTVIGEPTSEDAVFSDDVVTMLRHWSLGARLVFYIALRARLRYLGAYARRSVEWDAAFAREGEALASQLEALAAWRERATGAGDDNGLVSVYQGAYSSACSLSLDRLSAMSSADIQREVTIRDARELESRSVDVIVADPPYGFNTNDSADGLAALYRDVIRGMVRAVRDGGHIVICLPARSHTGRRLPVCTRRDLVTLQVLSQAHEAGRQVIVLGQALPGRGYLFQPPYYWESERALKRIILHFRIRDKMGAQA